MLLKPAEWDDIVDAVVATPATSDAAYYFGGGLDGPLQNTSPRTRIAPAKAALEPRDFHNGLCQRAACRAFRRLSHRAKIR